MTDVGSGRRVQTKETPVFNQHSAQHYNSRSPFPSELSKKAHSPSELSHQRLGDSSRNESEADSLLDLYRQQKAGLSSTHNSSTSGTMARRNFEGEEVEKEKWIHRDKLAAIESQEARAAGVIIPQEFAVDSITSDDKRGFHALDYEQEVQVRNKDGNQRQRAPSPAGEGNLIHDPRTFGEISADLLDGSGSPRIYAQQGLRSSSSRIPIATSSPLPIPQEHLERSHPLPRRRGTSGNWEEDGLVYCKIRSRSQSVGSQVLLDDGEPLDAAPRHSNYAELSTFPAKSKVTARSQPSSGSRKVSTNSRNVSAAQKFRPTSTTASGSPAQRPATRSGGEGRPAIAINRPEGEAPWLATMYKPDPRLPPDQQIIPTHAKRLQQEKWEREGKSGSSTDSNATQADKADPLSTKTPTNDDPQHWSDSSAWPLKTLSRPVSVKVPKSPGYGSEHGGYSTIPKVHSTPLVGPTQSPRLPQEMEVQQAQADTQAKEAGCGCCAVM